jgi:hypothetical protein
MLGLGLVTSCTGSKFAANPPQPGSGIQEYREITQESVAAVQATLRALDKVNAQAECCPRKVFDAFSTQVQNLQVASLRVRARSQAIQTRGDAYFQDWHESLSRVKDPKVRGLAQRFRPELQRAFANVKAASQEARTAYKNFSSGLLTLQSGLETDLHKIQMSETRDLIQITRKSGDQVLQSLATIQKELRTMSDLLTPAETG